MIFNETEALERKRIGGGGTCSYSDDVGVYTPRSPSTRNQVIFMALVCIFALSVGVTTLAVIEAFRVVIGGKPLIPFIVTITVVMAGTVDSVVSLRAMKLVFER